MHHKSPVRGCELAWTGSEQLLVLGSCEHGNEPSDSMKDGDLLAKRSTTPLHGVGFAAVDTSGTDALIAVSHLLTPLPRTKDAQRYELEAFCHLAYVLFMHESCPQF
jgi:hypothetical protein